LSYVLSLLAITFYHTGTSVGQVDKCTYWKVTSYQNEIKLSITVSV